MNAAVPFALLATAQLLAVAALLGLVPAAFGTALRAGLVSSCVISAGAVAAAVADALTGAQLGDRDGNALLIVQASGLAVLGAGLAATRSATASRVGAQGTDLAAVAPLGAAVPIGLASGGAGLLAAAGAWRRGAPGRVLLAGGLLLLGVAGTLAPAARTNVPSADAMLGIRTLGALGVIAALAVLARTSVLSKIVFLLGVGIAVTAVAVAGVVGTVVADRLSADQAHQLRTAAVGARADLQNDATTAQQLATLAAGCATTTDAVISCATSVAQFASGGAFTAVVEPGSAVRAVGGPVQLDRASLLDLEQQDAVREALAKPAFVGSGFVLLRGAPDRLIALGIASHRDPSRPAGAPSVVVIYGAAIDDGRLAKTQTRSTFDATVLAEPDGAPIASSLSGPAAAAVAKEADRHNLVPRLTATTGAIAQFGNGSAPSAGYVLLDSGTSPAALLILSAPNNSVLHTQQLVLELLFTALVVIGLIVGAAAIIVGRRAVNPVLRLTNTARAVGEGDLNARPDVHGVDEVGLLARAFGQMTASLQTMTEDLRETADAEVATRARLATVLDALTDALVVTDAAGTVTVINPAARALLGDVVGRAEQESIRTTDGQPLLSGEGWLAAAGSAVPVAISRAALPDGQGNVLLLRDVTAARQLEQAKTEFLANVSHELRTPLTPILGYADLLGRHPDLSRDRIGSMANSIAASTRRMSRVVDLLVDVAALDAGRIHAAPEVIVVSSFASARLADWRSRVPDRAADLQRRVASGVPPISADRALLVRAVDELLDNAVKYTASGTPVVIHAVAGPPGQVLLTVRDSGPGLDPAQRDGLLGAFTQADGSATRAHDGLGLGLAFVARVAAVLGGRLILEAEPGRGAAFTLELPAAQSRSVGSASRRPTSAGTASVSRTGRARAARRRGGPSA